MLAWLDKIPVITLAMVALMIGIAPIFPEPHLVEKLRMLSNGTLEKPIDIFDLLMHATPSLLLLIRLVRMKNEPASPNQAIEDQE